MYKAGFDYSWQEASFAVCDEKGNLLLEEFHVFPPRNASGLTAWMSELLARHQLTLNEIGEWSVGSGPGSFTGLRVAASLVMGLCFGREIRRRAVSTASAMADSLNLSADLQRALVLFDGHRDELLGYGLDRTPAGFVPSGFHAVLSRDSLSALTDYDVLIALEKDAVRIQEIAGEKAAGKLRTVPHIRASFLITNCPDDFSSKLTDPVYLRPAVFVEPRIPRQIG
ncbi:MAG: tRNA (adenosine(37)-N6)-threonylcarbamoyltransferase complex dimerization subunit type 1 TsaB [Lentisphaeria bacterium]|nr:tRNA (adenosine(37)-N6)-threonylcarbamoyltransferase complex dimerization subunit type 1 TsaB [Lentisphaeria bacterium]